MTPGFSFAAHLAAVARIADPTGRGVGGPLDAVVSAWNRLAAAGDPRFQLDGVTLWVGGAPVPVRRPWQSALASLETSLRAHGAGGATLSGPVDRAAVLALLRVGRALPATASRDEARRWLAEHGGAAIELLPPRVSAPDPRASLARVLRAWNVFVASVEGAPSAVPDALRALVEQAEADPGALAVVHALSPPVPQRRAACVALVALVVGVRLRLGRAALVDLGIAAVEAGTSAPDARSGGLAHAIERRVPPRLGRTDVRAVATLWGLHPDRVRTAHLFARIVALAEDADTALRAGRTGADDDRVPRIQLFAGRRHDAPLVHLLVGAIGRWPVGTTVLLDSGELGVVVRPPAASEHLSRPVLRIVADRAGALLAGGPVLDLAHPGATRSVVIASVDAARMGIDVQRAVLG